MSSYSLKGPDKAFNRKTKAPVLVNVTPAEAESVRSMFKLFDHNSEGHIPNYLARNLMKELGFDVNMLACFAEEVFVCSCFCTIHLFISFYLGYRK